MTVTFPSKCAVSWRRSGLRTIAAPDTVRPMPTATTLRPVAAIRYVTPLREGGSLPGLIEADDDGRPHVAVAARARA